MHKNGKSFIISDSAELLELKDLFSSGMIQLQAYGSDFRYLTGADENTNLRSGDKKSESPVAADDAASTYEVAAGSYYRVGEEVLIYDGSDNYKGPVIVRGIDTNVITVEKVRTITLESTDKLVTYSDPILVSGDIIDVPTLSAGRVKIVALASSTIENLIATLISTDIKKKR